MSESSGSEKLKTWPEIISQAEITSTPLSIDDVRTPGEGYPMSAWSSATNVAEAVALPPGPAMSSTSMFSSSK